MKVLGICISRQGSKRFPGKNVKMMCGRPLMEWTLLQLASTKHISGHWLVTDSEEQAKLGEKHGFHIVWQDPKDIDAREAEGRLGGPYAMKLGLDDAQKWCKDRNEGLYNVIVPLIPTQCLRKPDDIDRGIEYWLGHQELAVTGGTPYKDIVIHELKDGIAHPVLWDNNGRYWNMHGAIVVCSPEQFIHNQFKEENKAFTFDEQLQRIKTWPFAMEQWQGYDIDFPADWDLPEYFLEHKILKGDIDVYQKYREYALSEFGFEQHAAQYNQGVEQNLLPAEYRNSFFNHLPVYLECMKVPDQIVGWELNELTRGEGDTIDRRRMKLIRARNGSDVFDEANVLTERKPALIIGSGPSLDDALPILGDWKGGVFCSTSQASSLVRFGCEPSHIIAYDINTRPFEQNWVDTWEGRKTVMVTHPGMYPGTLESWPLRKMYFKSMDTSNFFFTSVLPVAYGDVIPSHMFLFSCSVSAQMSIAHALGYGPLFFIGCDFLADRFRKWVYDHDKNEWKQDPDHQVSLGNYITTANGLQTDALQIFYKRSVICVWRIDRSPCIQTSDTTALTEMPYVPIKDVVAAQGRGFDDKVLSDQETDDVAEKYLARFNQFILRFTPDERGKVSYRVLESHAGPNWKEDVLRYIANIKMDMKNHRMKLDIDINENMQRFIWLKEQLAMEDKVVSNSDKR